MSYPQEFLHKKEQLMELKKWKSWAWEALMHSYLWVLFSLLWSQRLQFLWCDPRQPGKLQRQDLTSSPYVQSFSLSLENGSTNFSPLLPSLHRLSRAEGFHFLCPSLFRQNCAYPHLDICPAAKWGASYWNFPAPSLPQGSSLSSSSAFFGAILFMNLPLILL